MIEIYSDGGAQPNPGKGAWAFVVVSDGKEMLRKSGYVGDCVSNNTCEYIAMYRAVKCVREIGLAHVVARSDSQLLIRQLNGQYQVRNEKLKKYHSAILALSEGVRFEWNPRESKWSAVCDAMCDSVILEYE